MIIHIWTYTKFYDCISEYQIPVLRLTKYATPFIHSLGNAR